MNIHLNVCWNAYLIIVQWQVQGLFSLLLGKLDCRTLNSSWFIFYGNNFKITIITVRETDRRFKLFVFLEVRERIPSDRTTYYIDVSLRFKTKLPVQFSLSRENLTIKERDSIILYILVIGHQRLSSFDHKILKWFDT